MTMADVTVMMTCLEKHFQRCNNEQTDMEKTW